MLATGGEVKEKTLDLCWTLSTQDVLIHDLHSVREIKGSAVMQGI